MKGAVLDFLHSGRLLNSEPEYRCTHCGQTVKNYDLSEVLERRIYGHVTCRCIMGDIAYRQSNRGRAAVRLTRRADMAVGARGPMAPDKYDLGDMPW